MDISVCSFDLFLEKIKNIDNIVFWGAGKRMRSEAGLTLLDVVFSVNPNLFLIDSVFGESIESYNHTIKIQDKYAILRNMNSQNCIIIATPADKTGIFDEIKSMDGLSGVECFDCYILYNLYKDYEAINKTMPDNLRILSEPVIPKKLHYCWFGGKEIPDEYKRYMESWYKLCPDYEIIQWNESNYDISKNQYMKEAYEAKKWGFVPDYARLDIVFNEGGIYIDTDVELIRNYDELLYQKAFVGIENEKRIACGLGFGAEQYHPVIKELRDMYDSMSFLNPDGSYNLVASPVFSTKYFVEHGFVQNGEYQIVKDVTILPEKVLAAKSFRTYRILKSSDNISIHHYAGSWLDDANREAVKNHRKVYSNL